MTSFWGSQPMLIFRDGPNACKEYSRSLARDPSVNLCVTSVHSVVKKEMNTIEVQKYTGQHRINNKDNPQALHGIDPHAGGEYFVNTTYSLESSWLSVKTSVNSVFKKKSNHREHKEDTEQHRENNSGLAPLRENKRKTNKKRNKSSHLEESSDERSVTTELSCNRFLSAFGMTVW
uniref:hypothetical protein n=1 Tax=uncultured Draconibacterium sp. TaxID=1573823 RepID=UPI0032168B3E